MIFWVLFSEKPDSCTINGVLFLNHSEFLTVNNTGQLKVYDIRSKSDDPVQMLSMWVYMCSQ
jgi:hypothetical protein